MKLTLFEANEHLRSPKLQWPSHGSKTAWNRFPENRNLAGLGLFYRAFRVQGNAEASKEGRTQSDVHWPSKMLNNRPWQQLSPNPHSFQQSVEQEVHKALPPRALQASLGENPKLPLTPNPKSCNSQLLGSSSSPTP